MEELADVFSAPRWLRDLGSRRGSSSASPRAPRHGRLLGATAVITQPVLSHSGGIRRLAARELARAAPRPAGRRGAIVLLFTGGPGRLVLLLVIGGIVSQSDEAGAHAGEAADKIQGWLEDAGVDSSGASSATESVKQDTRRSSRRSLGPGDRHHRDHVPCARALLRRPQLFFLLGRPSLRAGVEQHRASRSRRTDDTGNVIRSLRGTLPASRSSRPQRCGVGLGRGCSACPGRHDRSRRIRDGVHP